MTERNDRTQTRVITEHKELYNFLATPGIEVTNLAFANDDVVWISWKHAAEERLPNLRHTNEVTDAYITAGARIHLYPISTGWERELTIATAIPSFTISRETNQDLSKQGTNWVK